MEMISLKKIIGIIVCVAMLMCLCLTACAAQPEVSEDVEAVTITGIAENVLAIAAFFLLAIPRCI